MEAVVAQPQDWAVVEARVHGLSNDDLIIDLIQTLNHLSRWLTPIHDRTRLEYSAHRSEPSVKDVLLGMRDTEVRMYSLMYAIATQVNPDLDRVPVVERTALQQQADRSANALVIMSEFRRVRESSTSLLRALPDNAWVRDGHSRNERDWTIRELGEFLAINDWARLGEIDRKLSRIGVRETIAEVSRVRLEAIRKPFPVSVGRN